MTLAHFLMGCFAVLAILHLHLIVKHARLKVRNHDLERRLLSYRLMHFDRRDS